jgi:hypothetical protein
LCVVGTTDALESLALAPKLAGVADTDWGDSTTRSPVPEDPILRKREEPAAPLVSAAIACHCVATVPHDQGDERTYLQDAAAAARHAGAGRQPGETRTDLWINAPASIGSTSPPQAGSVTPSGEK